MFSTLQDLCRLNVGLITLISDVLCYRNISFHKKKSFYLAAFQVSLFLFICIDVGFIAGVIVLQTITYTKDP